MAAIPSTSPWPREGPPARCFECVRTRTAWSPGVKYAAVYGDRVYWWWEASESYVRRWTQEAASPERIAEYLRTGALKEVALEEVLAEIDDNPYRHMDIGPDPGV